MAQLPGSSFMSALLGGHGCNPDGTTSRNPLTAAVENIFNSHLMNGALGNIGIGVGGSHESPDVHLQHYPMHSPQAAAPVAMNGNFDSVWSMNQNAGPSTMHAPGQHQHMHAQMQMMQQQHPDAMRIRHHQLMLQQHFMQMQQNMAMMQQRQRMMQMSQENNRQSEAIEDNHLSSNEFQDDGDVREEGVHQSDDTRDFGIGPYYEAEYGDAEQGVHLHDDVGEDQHQDEEEYAYSSAVVDGSGDIGVSSFDDGEPFSTVTVDDAQGDLSNLFNGFENIGSVSAAEYAAAATASSIAGGASGQSLQEQHQYHMDSYAAAWEHLQSRIDEYSSAASGGAQEAVAGTMYEQHILEQQQKLHGQGYDASRATEYDESRPQAYDFAAENKFAEDEVNSFEKGVAYFEEGNIKDAILAFEAELQRDAEHDECWRYLGLCHAENDEDTRAINCFRNAIHYDPFNIDALLALGTSYTNEMKVDEALDCLRNWVVHNPAFQNIQHELGSPSATSSSSAASAAQDEDDAAYGDGSALDEVMQLMLNVSRQVDSMQHSMHTSSSRSSSTTSSGAVATITQVNTVLGVLYNLSLDYDAAAVCFRKALDYLPENYSLWNKLGATMANNERSKEALAHYSKALSLRPRFGRGWLNLGIAYANLDMYEEASRAYIKALQICPTATHIWGFLRVTLAGMDRMDLVHLSNNITGAAGSSSSSSGSDAINMAMAPSAKDGRMYTSEELIEIISRELSSPAAATGQA